MNSSIDRPRLNVLSQTELQAYRQDGLTVPRVRLSGPELEAVQQLTCALATENPGLLEKPFISPHVSQNARTNHQAWFELARTPYILDMIEQIIGSDIILFNTVLFYKAAGGTPVTPFHQDGPAFPIRPMEAALVWLAVFDSVVENGALRYIPGSHASRRNFEIHRYEGSAFTAEALAIDESQFDLCEARDVELEAGQMVIFHPYLIHGSHPNDGTRTRAGYALRYMPSTSHYDRKWAASEPGRFAPGAATRPIFLVRGTDRSGLNFADI